MSFRIGVVCEGSHDFIVIRELLARLFADGGIANVLVDPLQPAIDATSKQVDGGGWAAVTGWCKRNCGEAWRVFFDEPLFANSPRYDLIVVHLDGDVLEVSNKFSPAQRRAVGGSTVRRVGVVSDWITGLLSLPLGCKQTLVTAVPTLHMESWLLAGLVPDATNVEARACKGRVKQLLRRRFQGNPASQVSQAAALTCQSLGVVRAACASFRQFDRQVQAVLA
jgi:hypothetical protein